MKCFKKFLKIIDDFINGTIHFLLIRHKDLATLGFWCDINVLYCIHESYDV